MISWPHILQLLGYFLLGLTLSLIAPLLLAVLTKDDGLGPLTAATLVCFGLALILIYRSEPAPHQIHRREGILFVVAAWISAALVGALPFYFAPDIPSFTDAFFESISGFTTTGATILTDIEGLAPSLLLWRSVTHWVGGMGIILLGIAILPLLGTGGTELYRAEFSGARSERLTPRIAETALALWKIYVLFTLLEYLALRLAGLGSFDAVCHSFATMATGGFSTRAMSIESFQNPAVEYIIIFFMIVAGINFTQHYRLLIQSDPRAFFRDIEIRAYLVILLAATLAVAASLLLSSIVSGAEQAFRLASFQVVSIMTTTGFSTADFELWTPFAKLVLLALMFAGGCTGSTAGGLKIARLVLLLRVVRREFQRMVEKRGVFAVRMSGRAVPENTIGSLLNPIYLAFLINFAGCLALTLLGVDVLTAISAVAAAMFNIGPGLGTVGPSDNYAHLPVLAKWVLGFCMLAGRLEYYTALVLLAPAFWRK